MPGSRAREIVRRSLGALTVTALLGAAVAVAAGLSWPGPVRATDAVPASTAAVPGLAPTHRRFHHVADPHDCADPDDLAPGQARRPAQQRQPDITDPEDVANPDPERQRPGRQSRHRHDGSPRPRRELLRQRGDHPAGGRNRGCSRPASIGDSGIGFERLRPAATNVEVTAGGQALVVPDGPITSEVTLHWASPTKQVQLRYRLSQVSIASAHAKPGRALAAFGSLLGRMPADLPVTVVVTGKTRAVAHLSATPIGHHDLRCR